MFIPSILLCALFGLLCNMSFTGLLIQPDWSLAILLGALLSYRRDWPWILPTMGLHDLIFFWSLGTTFPYFFLIAIMLTLSDKTLAPGQPQRWFGLVLGCLPLFLAGFSILSCFLTMALATGIWFGLSTQRGRDHVEPA